MTTVTQPRPRTKPAAAPRPDAAEPHGLAFGLFIVANAMLFVRPSDVLPALEGVQLYQFALLACMAVGFPAVLGHVAGGGVEKRPIDLCVLLMLPLVVVSHLAGGRPDDMYNDGAAYLKIVVYYLLLVSLVTTPWRMSAFCGWLIVFACAVAILAAMDFHKVIKLPRGLDLWGNPAVEDPTRMYGPGIFLDPNDVCVLIAVSTILVFGRLADVKAGFARWAWLVPLAVFGYGFYLTRSRGGMLALVAGSWVMAGLAWGWRTALLLGVLAAPLVGALLMMRGESDISSHQDSGQTRVQLWNAGMVMLRGNPVFGVGMNRFHQAGEANQVAHNSYMQAFAELGFPGGVLFFSATFLSLAGLLALRSSALVSGGRLQPRIILDPTMGQMYPALAGCVAAWAAGMFTLTLNYLVVTYVFFGMASMVLATTETSPPRHETRFEASLLAKMAGMSLVFLVGMFVLIRLLFRA